MPRRYPQLDLDIQLCFPLYAATRAVTSRYNDLLRKAGLTYPQYLTLLALWSASPMTVGELGRRLRLDSGTLSPLLKRLEVDGHVVRRRDPDDERRVIIELTEQGWALRDKVADVPHELASALGLTLEEAVQLGGLLGKVLESLD